VTAFVAQLNVLLSCPALPCPNLFLSFAVLAFCPLRCSVNDARFTQVQVTARIARVALFFRHDQLSTLVAVTDSTHTN